MPDQVVAVGQNGSILRRPDGSTYYSGAFIGNTIECGARDLAACAAATIGPIFPTLNPDASLASTIDLERRLAELLSLEARSILSFLPASVSPSLGILQNVSAFTGGLVPLLEASPELAAIANREAAQIDAFIEQTTDREPRDGKSPLELYLDGRDRSLAIEASPLVAAERARAMGLLEDLGITGFTSSGGGSLSNLFANFGVPTNDAGSPPIGTTSGGVLGSIFGTAGQVLDSAASPIIGILQQLAASGVIRGTVGNLLAPMQQSPSAGVSAGNVAAMNLAAGGTMPGLLEQLLLSLGPSGNSVGDGTMTGSALSMLENALGVNQGGGNCGGRSVRLSAAQAMPMFKQGCNRAYLPRRIFVDGPDGTPYVLYNAGQASIGSREKTVAKGIARRLGLKLTRPGTGGGRRRRPR
jgi:hypothetical protein